ncbi:cupin domain-containing protein [Acinetobacter equi]|uniref:Anti-sigma factor n=1 Tax=Acinetobacter equi TaxID=1324350 RepID=A0A0N7GXZ4_9GAMM|nr:cupin domain-containing protein [Acinetobacter equi]ALH96083.1 anti-sigma factor [Acinetobacter equi]
MRIHADFTKLIIITPDDYEWIKSPGGEVNRMMLDRIGEEQARATSLVEFAPNSQFPEHKHPLGEEVLVLSGVFTEDKEQHYPTGWYMRNQHQSVHQVSSERGCRIFVKLMQMTEDELEPTRINTLDSTNWVSTLDRYICPLYESKIEKTFLEKLDANQNFSETLEQDVEIFIIEGELCSDSNFYPTGSWLRIPQKSNLQLCATALGATIYIKSGHLQHAMNVWSNEAR